MTEQFGSMNWSDTKALTDARDKLEKSRGADVQCSIDPDRLTYSGWKIHVYGKSIDDALRIMQCIGNYLEYNGIMYKVGTKNRFGPGTVESQRVKAVTIYVPDASGFKQLVNDLMGMMKGYTTDGPMPSDKPLGGSLHYRYEFTKPVTKPVDFGTYKALYTNAGANYNIPGNPDPLQVKTGAAPAKAQIAAKRIGSMPSSSKLGVYVCPVCRRTLGQTSTASASDSLVCPEHGMINVKRAIFVPDQPSPKLQGGRGTPRTLDMDESASIDENTNRSSRGPESRLPPPSGRAQPKCPHCKSDNVTDLNETYVDSARGQKWKKYNCNECGTEFYYNVFSHSCSFVIPSGAQRFTSEADKAAKRAEQEQEAEENKAERERGKGKARNLAVSVSGDTKWRVKGKIFEMFALVIGAIVASTFNFTLLATALVLYIPYMVMPNEYRLMAKASDHAQKAIKNGQLDYMNVSDYVEESVRKSAGILWMRAVFKLSVILLVMFEFIGRTFFVPLSWIALAVGFIAYFDLPSSYKPNQPWKIIEGWMRFALGVFNSALLWAILTGQTTAIAASIQTLGWFMLIPFIGPFIVLAAILVPMSQALLSPATGMFLLGLAFFAIPPVGEKEVS